jgi:adenylate kinase family enzyme
MRIAIIGNSGSGKSTLSRDLSARGVVAVLDLDTIAWKPGPTIERRSTDSVREDLQCFCAAHESWIVEGCYGNLVEIVLPQQPELIFVDPGEAACIENCRRRPWEPHKYASKAAQDANLEFLLNWVRDYYHRDDDCSFRRHLAIFESYAGPKRRIRGCA